MRTVPSPAPDDDGHRRRVDEIDGHHGLADTGVDQAALAGVAEPDDGDGGAFQLVEQDPVVLEALDQVGPPVLAGVERSMADDGPRVDERVVHCPGVGHPVDPGSDEVRSTRE